MLLYFLIDMLKRINIIMIISLFGVLLLPEQSFACALHSNKTEKVENSCCSNKQQAQDKEKQASRGDMACCKTSDQEHNSCSGQCGMQSCHSTTFSFSATSSVFRNVQHDFNFKNKKSYPIYLQNSYSLREFSIWQPPKIS